VDGLATRRELMVGAAGAAAVAGGFGADRALADTAPPSDADLLTKTLEVERLMVFAYERVLASGALSPGVQRVITPFLAQERAHVAAVAAALSLALAWVAPAQVIMKEPPPEARDVGLVSKLGEKVPMDLEFVNGEGKPVKLGQYFKSGKPVILALVYYRCPMICPLVLQRLQEGLNGLSYIVGEDYNCVVLSFDPSEKPAAAAEAKTLYLEGYNKPVTPSVRAGWDFLVCPNSNVRMLATAVVMVVTFAGVRTALT